MAIKFYVLLSIIHSKLGSKTKTIQFLLHVPISYYYLIAVLIIITASLKRLLLIVATLIL